MISFIFHFRINQKTHSVPPFVSKITALEGARKCANNSDGDSDNMNRRRTWVWHKKRKKKCEIMKKTGKHNFKFYYSLLPPPPSLHRSYHYRHGQGRCHARKTCSFMISVRLQPLRFKPIHRYYHMYPPRRIINKKISMIYGRRKWKKRKYRRKKSQYRSCCRLSTEKRKCSIKK